MLTRKNLCGMAELPWADQPVRVFDSPLGENKPESWSRSAPGAGASRGASAFVDVARVVILVVAYKGKTFAQPESQQEKEIIRTTRGRDKRRNMSVRDVGRARLHSYRRGDRQVRGVTKPHENPTHRRLVQTDRKCSAPHAGARRGGRAHDQGRSGSAGPGGMTSNARRPERSGPFPRPRRCDRNRQLSYLSTVRCICAKTARSWDIPDVEDRKRTFDHSWTWSALLRKLA